MLPPATEVSPVARLIVTRPVVKVTELVVDGIHAVAAVVDVEVHGVLVDDAVVALAALYDVGAPAARHDVVAARRPAR